MRKIIILIVLSLIVFYLNNCISTHEIQNKNIYNSKNNQNIQNNNSNNNNIRNNNNNNNNNFYTDNKIEMKHMLRVLAGGLIGDIITGNFGGFILGSFLVDATSVAVIDYEHIQLEEREEASRRYKYRQKYTEELKDEQKKVEEKKEREKKAEELREKQKRVELFIEESLVKPQFVKIGSKIEAKVQYTLLSPSSDQQVKIIEKRILANQRQRLELDKREVIRNQGTHSSTIKFTVSDNMPKGYCLLLTTISDGKDMKTTKSEVIINR